MDKYEKLAGLTAISKGVEEALKQARSDVASEMLPTERKILSFNGVPVGSCTVSAASKKTNVKAIVTNPKELMKWCEEHQVYPTMDIPPVWYGRNGFCDIKGTSLVNIRSGEVVPGVELILTEKDTGGVFSVRDCDVETVMPLIRDNNTFIELISTDETMLLEDGE